MPPSSHCCFLLTVLLSVLQCFAIDASSQCNVSAITNQTSSTFELPVGFSRLCMLDSIDALVLSDRKPVLNEDCELSLCNEDGTFVMYLSLWPASVSQFATFVPTADFPSAIGQYNLTEQGLFRFIPQPDRHGPANILVSVFLNGFNCTASCSFNLHVTSRPDQPSLFVLNSDLELVTHEASTALTASASEWLTVEQNTHVNAAYRDLEFVFGAFDSDFESTDRRYYLNARILTSPRYGKLFIERSEEFLASSGSQSEANDSVCGSPQKAFRTPRCLPRHVLRDGQWTYKWMLTTMRYQPVEMYSGMDWFEIALEKWNRRLGSEFFHTKVKIAVLENLCRNNGTCVGHAVHNRDPQCKSAQRMAGFYRLHYRCLCPDGWAGNHCETAVQSSSSSRPATSPPATTDGEKSLWAPGWPMRAAQSLQPGELPVRMSAIGPTVRVSAGQALANCHDCRLWRHHFRVHHDCNHFVLASEQLVASATKRRLGTFLLEPCNFQIF